MDTSTRSLDSEVKTWTKWRCFLWTYESLKKGLGSSQVCLNLAQPNQVPRLKGLEWWKGSRPKECSKTRWQKSPWKRKVKRNMKAGRPFELICSWMTTQEQPCAKEQMNSLRAWICRRVNNKQIMKSRRSSIRRSAALVRKCQTKKVWRKRSWN